MAEWLRAVVVGAAIGVVVSLGGGWLVLRYGGDALVSHLVEF